MGEAPMGESAADENVADEERPEETADNCNMIKRWSLSTVPGLGYATGMSNGRAQQFAIEIARFAQDHKSEGVIALDMRGLSPVTDFTVICTGTSERQMRAVADHIVEYGKTVGERPYGVCGYDSATWIIIDYVDVVFHVFAKKQREFYDLELLWGDAPRVDWARSESA